jgi:hypothetical protein
MLVGKRTARMIRIRPGELRAIPDAIGVAYHLEKAPTARQNHDLHRALVEQHRLPAGRFGDRRERVRRGWTSSAVRNRGRDRSLTSIEVRVR